MGNKSGESHFAGSPQQFETILDPETASPVEAETLAKFKPWMEGRAGEGLIFQWYDADVEVLKGKMTLIAPDWPDGIYWGWAPRQIEDFPFKDPAIFTVYDFYEARKNMFFGGQELAEALLEQAELSASYQPAACAVKQLDR